MKTKQIPSFEVPVDIFRIVQEYNLSKSEILVYMYTMKHSLSTNRTGDMKGVVHLTYDEMMTGVNLGEGYKADDGTGLSYTSIYSAIKSLTIKGLLQLLKVLNGNRYCYRVYFPHPKSREKHPLTGDGNRLFIFDRQSIPGDLQVNSTCVSSSKSSSNGHKPSLLKPSLSTKKQDKYHQAASKLWNALGERNLLDKRSSINQWTKTFKETVNKLELEWDRVSTVLDWYCDNIKGDRVPQAFSAKTFLTKFFNIEASMEIAKRKERSIVEEDIIEDEVVEEESKVRKEWMRELL